MENKTDSQKTKTATTNKKIRILKKKPLILVTAIMAVIIIALAVALIITASSKNTVTQAASEQSASTASAADEPAGQEEEAVAYPYDDSKWTKQMQTGFMSYEDDNYTSTIGLDVSEWSLDIDWEAVKASGIDFVICRVGYRGYGTGKFQFDEKLYEYLEGADAAGIKTGVYFVTQAINEKEAIEEAETVMDMIKDYNITMPIYIDCEANSGEETRTDKLTREEFTNNAIAFCKAVEEKGYRGGIYSNDTWISKSLDMSKLTDYDIWFAKYTDTPETDIPFTMWQYSATGIVDGLTTNADLNIRLEKK